MRPRPIALAAAGLAVVLALSGCSTAGTATETKGALAMGFAGSDIPIWNDQLAIMKSIIEEAGYEFLTSDPQWDVQAQVSDWDSWINRGDVKAIGGYPIQKDAMVPVTARATAEGIPVFGYITDWDGVSAVVVADSYTNSKTVATNAAAWIAEKYGADTTQTVAVLGDRTSDNGIASTTGLIDGITEALPNAKITELASFTRDDGYKAAQSQLVADPSTAIWLGFTSDVTAGAYQAVLDSGVAADDPDYLFGCLDATNETLDLIEASGSMWRSTVVVPAQGLAEANAKLLIDGAEGKAVKDITVDGVVVTADNADDYRLG